MTLQLTWPEVVGALGGQTIFLAVAAWLIRKLVSHGIDRDLERYKTELKAQADIEIERLKTALQITAHQHQVRFSKLHEKRADVVAELYKLMIETVWAAKIFIYGDAHNRDKANTANDKARALYTFFEVNRLYLPDSVCIFIDKYVGQLFHAVVFIRVFWTDIENPTPETINQQNAQMRAAVESLETELPKIRKLLETEFRTLLGGTTDEEWMFPVKSEKA